MAGSSKTDRQVSRLLDKEDEQGILAMVRDGAVGADDPVTYAPAGETVWLLPAAIRRGWTDLALELIQRGADIDRREQGQTPLMFACAFQNHPVIEVLVERGAKLDLKTPKGESESDDSALMIAAEKADVWAVKRLLRAGANAKVLNFRKQSAIHSALKPKPSVGVVEIVRALIDAGTQLQGTELHFPVYQRDVEMTRLLLDRGCPLNVPFTYNEYAGPKKGETPLTSAVRSQPIDTTDAPGIGLTPTEPQRLEIARLLMAAGADPNLPGAKGWTPLMIAVAEKHLELARMLLKAGADPRRVPPNVKIESPAALAAKKGLEKFMQLFAQHR
jgi:ankyrin repeat protein